MPPKRNCIHIHTYLKKDLMDWVKEHAIALDAPYNRVIEEAIKVLKAKVESEQGKQNLLGLSNKIS